MKKRTVLEEFTNLKVVAQFLQGKAQRVLFQNTPDNAALLLAWAVNRRAARPVLVLTPSLTEAAELYEKLVKLAGEEQVLFYPADDFIRAEVLQASPEFASERQYVLSALLNSEAKIVVTHTSAAFRPLATPESYRAQLIKLQPGTIIAREALYQKLVAGGFRREAITQSPGEFSVRGSVIDIYPLNQPLPIRLDLFDDEIETIKSFDVETQLSSEKLKEVVIYPCEDAFFEPLMTLKAKLTAHFKEEAVCAYINNLDSFEQLRKFNAYFPNSGASLFDYAPDCTLFVINPAVVKHELQNLATAKADYLQEYPFLKAAKLKFIADSTVLWHAPRTVYTEEFIGSVSGLKLDAVFNLEATGLASYNGQIDLLSEDLKLTTQSIVIACEDEANLVALKEILNNAGLYRKLTAERIKLIVDPHSLGFATPEIKVIDQATIWPQKMKELIKYRSSGFQVLSDSANNEIEIGDYVVHEEHGIAQYLGIETTVDQTSGAKTDKIVLKFANLQLLLPVEKISSLLKYSSFTGSPVKLSTYGSKAWKNKKARIRKEIEQLATDLLDTQVARELAGGRIYPADGELQHRFEADFRYMETPDQLETLAAIKNDMERGVLIDRLICGDVGFGKTEVAMRIAMKTILAGEQVAYLAPTTILSRQHYYTFKERFDKYGVKVELLNRLVVESKVKRILRELAAGTIDVIIGTHKILNDKLQYKNLGLLIIDEEQRFGVAHKEKIKRMKARLNVLTLTATPIPRTMQLTLSGIRQLSLIQTPPKNRMPIQTYVLAENALIIKDAIVKELARHGQVFFLHNRIDDLDLVVARLQALVPHARVAKAHGKMQKEEMEGVVEAFINQEYDVLVSTTIIETGIDIPNANTLLVDCSDHLGLAQMHQLRGRVGRSNKLAFAYFMFSSAEKLTAQSRMRLSAIKDFTKLGSGFKLALEDLAIRGAGSVLGKKQSGFINDVGMELYLKLLNEEVQKRQGAVPPAPEGTWHLGGSQHIDDNYVPDDELKVYIHQHIAAIKTWEDREKLIAELENRFGRLNVEIFSYINKKYVKSALARGWVDHIENTVRTADIYFTKEFTGQIAGDDFLEIVMSAVPEAKIIYKKQAFLVMIPKSGFRSNLWIEGLMRICSNIEQRFIEKPKYS